MFQFVRDNILLVLTILAAVISFLASFIGIVAQKKPIIIPAVLAVLGLSISISYQIFNYDQKKEEKRRNTAKEQIAEAAQRARDNVVNEINLTVQQTKITVDSIAKQLNKATIQDVATELVNIRSSGNVNFEETEAFAKGSPDLWHRFADWLSSFRSGKVAPSLSLYINGNHYYESGLLLVYLLTSDATRDSLQSVPGHHNAWHSFNADEIYLKAFAPHSTHLQWVLFDDDRTQQPVAYAEAQEFTQQLMVYHRLQQHDRINNLLNAQGPNTIAELQKAFPSIQTAVFKTKSPQELATLLIDQQLAVGVATADQKTYVAKLVHMIQVATR